MTESSESISLTILLRLETQISSFVRTGVHFLTISFPIFSSDGYMFLWSGQKEMQRNYVIILYSSTVRRKTWIWQLKKGAFCNGFFSRSCFSLHLVTSYVRSDLLDGHSTAPARDSSFSYAYSLSCCAEHTNTHLSGQELEQSSGPRYGAPTFHTSKRGWTADSGSPDRRGSIAACSSLGEYFRYMWRNRSTTRPCRCSAIDFNCRLQFTVP